MASELIETETGKFIPTLDSTNRQPYEVFAHSYSVSGQLNLDRLSVGQSVPGGIMSLCEILPVRRSSTWKTRKRYGVRKTRKLLRVVNEWLDRLNSNGHAS